MARAGVRSRLAWCSAVLLAALVVPTDGPATRAAEGVAATVLAEHVEPSLALTRRWVLRDEHPLDGDAHGHASGFLYQVEAESVLAYEDGSGVTLHVGDATWMPWGVGHLHRRPSGTRGGTGVTADELADVAAGTAAGTATTAGAGPRSWAFLLETEPKPRRPGTRWVSPTFRDLRDGAYTARLVREAFAPGAATPPRRHAGPELLYFQAGRWEVRDPAGRAVLEGERIILVDPGIPYALRNVADGPASLSRLSLVPTGRPTAEGLPPDALDE